MESKAEHKSLDTMADELISFFSQRGFHSNSVQNYRRHIESIRNFSDEQGLNSYTANECDMFIRQIIQESVIY